MGEAGKSRRAVVGEEAEANGETLYIWAIMPLPCFEGRGRRNGCGHCGGQQRECLDGIQSFEYTPTEASVRGLVCLAVRLSARLSRVVGKVKQDKDQRGVVGGRG